MRTGRYAVTRNGRSGAPLLQTDQLHEAFAFFRTLADDPTNGHRAVVDLLRGTVVVSARPHHRGR